MSNNSEYLRVLAEGGDTSSLPKPNSVNGEYLYKICNNGGVSNNSERVIFCSDLHINTSNMGNISDVLAGVTPRANVEHFIDTLNKEHRIKPIKAVFFLGDFTLGYGKDGLEYFVKHYLPQLEMPFYIGCGDHDFNTNEEVTALLGYGREWSVDIGKNTYIYIDGYKDTIDQKTLSSLDEENQTARIQSALDRGQSVYLMCHWSNAIVSNSYTTASWRSFIRKYCSGVFCGHSHNTNASNMGYGDLYFYETGNFSYPAGSDWSKIGDNAENRRCLRNFELDKIDNKYYSNIIYPTDDYTISGTTTVYDYEVGEKIEVKQI